MVNSPTISKMADESSKEAGAGDALNQHREEVTDNAKNDHSNTAPLMIAGPPPSHSSQQNNDKNSEKNVAPPPGISRVIERSKEPQSLQELLKWCMQNQNQGGDIEEMSAERKEWLAQALKSVNVDTIEILKTNIEKFQNPDANVEETIEALEYVNEIIQDLDNSRDLYILGGLRSILALLHHANENIRAGASELLATSVQNHPECQTLAFQGGALPLLISSLKTEQIVKVKAKIIRALSCLIRGHGPLHESFLKEHDGVSLLAHSLQTTGDSNIQTKLVYMLSNLCVDPAVKENLVGSHVAETVVSILEANVECAESLDLTENSLKLLLSLAEHAKSLPAISVVKESLISVIDSRREFIKNLPKEEQVRYVEEVILATKLKKILA